MTTWTEHVAKWRDCTKCPLHAQRSNIVLARGTVPCDVLFIGEAPGTSEDALALPFVGPAGKLLDQIIERALLTGTTYALTNLVACFPQEAKARGDNEPEHGEIMACRPRLEEFVAIAAPKLIVAVGELAETYVRDLSVARAHITHPAAILRMKQAQKGFAVQKAVVVLRFAVEGVI